ncbi:allophanate hydrolase [Faunimonas sp. B44]|uniref:allophanate hydrolase n=1 Tax=Faunimonas sp. B44 TaxID=3461493 RepID=UPI004044276F
MTTLPELLDFASLRAFYAGGGTPAAMAEAVIARMRSAKDPAIFITRVPEEALLSAAQALVERAPEPNALPLWGLPFVVKDNIDVAGLPTTAGCPDFAYGPDRDAAVIARLVAAGALLLGKTNLDQFATGLNGTRSPYGAPRCVFDPDYVSGGSSSGSAVAVAAGLAAFSLGTDTAGSGRVPAAFNNVVGVKPTPGRVPTTGVVPACRSLDVVSIFACSVADAAEVRRVAEGFDAADPFSRRVEHVPLPAEGLHVGVLAEGDRAFFGNMGYEHLYAAAVERAQALGAAIVAIDYASFQEAAALLYDGPWVAERLAAIEAFATARPDSMDPTVRAIVLGAQSRTAVEAYRGQYRLLACRRAAEAEWTKADLLMLPTAPDIPTVDAMRADPVALNARLGLYTNFANLMGLAAISVPAGFTGKGLPFGVTLFGPGDSDEALAPFAHAMHAAAHCGSGIDRAKRPGPAPAPRTGGLPIMVVGAHLSGMPLNRELLAAGGTLVRRCRTAPDYRLYVLPDTDPPKPGLVRDPGHRGRGLEVEIWSLPPADFGRFVAAIPAPLGIGKVRLEDGSEVPGFLCEPAGLAGAEEITAMGGWRAYMDMRARTTAA